MSEVRPTADSNPDQGSRFQRFLTGIERVGNALPHPVTLFVGLSALVILISAIGSALNLKVAHPSSGDTVTVVNLLTVEGGQRILTELVRNFLAYPPLGISLACLMGIGLAEHSGLLGAALRALVLGASRRIITPLVVFAAVMSNAGSEVGYVLLVPLAASLYHALGRHPLLGLAAAFAGVSGGYSANLLIGSVDVLLAGLTQAAAQIVDANRQVNATANYYFMAASTLVVTAVGTWVTERIVAPRLGNYSGPAEHTPLTPLSPAERRGLAAAAITITIMVAVILAGLLPANGFLVNRQNPAFAQSAFMVGLPAFIFLFGFLPALAYGFAAGTLRNDHDVVEGMNTTMKSMASFLVLAFFAAQFIAYFNWTNLGIITAVGGAHLIEHLRLQDTPMVLMVAVVVFAAIVNILISSASAKWALLAPVFVPMFMLLGYSPELTQGAFRIGDSITNIITPLMSYFPLILTFAQKYDPKAGVGTMMALMLPFSIAFFIAWVLLLLVWIAANFPMGPGAPLRL